MLNISSCANRHIHIFYGEMSKLLRHSLPCFSYILVVKVFPWVIGMLLVYMWFVHILLPWLWYVFTFSYWCLLRIYFNDTQIIIFSKGIITKKSTLSKWKSCFLYFMSRIKKMYGALFFKVMPQQGNWQSLLAYGYISTVKIDSMRLGIIL